MIDMSSIYGHKDYQSTLLAFKSSKCKWSHFGDIHKETSKNRCPICECLVDGTVNRLANSGNSTNVISTIDHYRPQKYYPFLKCDHKNYLLMCSECNNIYKGSKFPLHGSPTRRRAENESEIENEKPLIVNPITDDLLALFELIFKRSSNGKNILELQPKASLTKGSYLYEKALATVKLFGLYDCANNRHANNNIFNCRVGILEEHFGVFHNFAKALKNGNKGEASAEWKSNELVFKQYGFFIFLQKNQFEDLIP